VTSVKIGGLFGLSNRFSDPVKRIVFLDYVNERMSANEINVLYGVN
jgi:hypothetical protein